MKKFIVEMHSDGILPVSPIRGKLKKDLEDCSKSGDCEPAIRYFLKKYDVEFRIVKKINDKYQNVIATAEDKEKTCKAIYSDSSSDFSDEETANKYLIWELASHEQ